MARIRIPRHNPVAVIGLGRFGLAVAESLSRMGHEVLAVDADADLVQRYADRFTQLVQADTTSLDVLKRLDLASFQHVVVSIGTNVEASVLTVLALSELGVPDIWAKAVGSNHGRILERTGAHHVVYPEAAMGERVAHMVTGKLIEFIQFDDGFAIAKTCAPAEAIGRTLSESGIRTKHGVTVVGVKREKADFSYADADTFVLKGDLIIVAGQVQAVERFAAII